MGETALGSLLGLPVNFSYKKGGDPYDFKLWCKFDIKTGKSSHWEMGFVMAINEYGCKIQLKSDIYVVAYIEEDDSVAKKAVISIVGFCTKDDILNKFSEIKTGKRGTQMNYELPYSELRSVRQLLWFIERVKEKSLQCQM